MTEFDVVIPSPAPGSAPSPSQTEHSWRPEVVGEKRGDPGQPLPPGLKLNLGCGPVQPSGWVNIDGSNRAKFASRLWPLDRALVKLGLMAQTEFGPHVRVRNLSRPLPYADESVSCIYAGELWEHFEYPAAERLTQECLRVLAPGGVLRVCVADGPAFWKRYLELCEEEMKRPRETRSAGRLHQHVETYFKQIATRRTWLGSLGHTYKWQYDEFQLVELLEDCGFTSVERMAFHRSRIPDVDQVERADLLIVEGVKLW